VSSTGGQTAGEEELGPPAAVRPSADAREAPGADRSRLRLTIPRAVLADPDGRSVWERLPLTVIAVLGVFGAAIDGALTAANPDAHPAHLAAGFRVAVIVALLLAGIFARTARLHARMGLALLASVPLATLWLLNGSESSLPFTIGLLFTGVAPVVFSYLLLAHPAGRLRTRAERRLIGWCGGTGVALWTLLILTHSQPPFTTPLVRCAPHCPQNLASLGAAPAFGTALATVVKAAWIVLCVGTLVLLVQRLARANAPVRRVIGPTVVVAAGIAVFLLAFLLAHAADWPSASAFAGAYLAAAVLTPAAILLGLLLERLFMGRALADLLERLSAPEAADVEDVLADALQDPTLTVAYGTGVPGRFVDGDGAPVQVPPRDASRAAVVLGRGGASTAAVLFDSELAEQERYVQAAGEAALMSMQKSRLESDRAISRVELAVSRRRVQEAAVEERRRIQRDLHDGAQQRLLAMRAAVTRLLEDPAESPGRRDALFAIRQELVETLAEVRSLAEGVYPPLLVEYGLARALRGVSRGMAAEVVISDESVGRFSTAVEGAVYLTCLEALQNIAKHAGDGSAAKVRLWREEGSLRFEVADDGRGFRIAELGESKGLVNMRDRIAALGGTLRVRSATGAGTVVSGSVLVFAENPDPEESPYAGHVPGDA
jgi:signal transduction histidine kinase